MSVSDVLYIGSKDHPKAFELAEKMLALYERESVELQETNRFDFRRGFELGYYTAMHNVDNEGLTAPEGDS